MAIVLIVVAIALIAFLAYRARPSAATWRDGEPFDAEPFDLDHTPGTVDPMTIDERVETSAIIDAWFEVVNAPTDEAKRAGEEAIIDRCDALLLALDDRGGIPDVDTAASALRSVLSMALFDNEQFDNCVEVLREQPVPDSLLEPRQRSVHPLPLMAKALTQLGELDEALAVLDADEDVDDRRDPASAALARAERNQQRSTIAHRRGDLAAAATHGTEALAAFTDLELKPEMARAERALGEIHLAGGSPADARLHLERAWQLFDEAGRAADAAAVAASLAAL